MDKIKKKGPPKGVSNNPAGRPKGVPNKITTEVKAIISELVEGLAPEVKKALHRLIKSGNDKEFLYTFYRYLRFVIPEKRDLTSDEKELFSTLRIIYDKNDTPEGDAGVREDTGGEEKA